MDANRTSSRYELKSELARYCLPAANRDSNRKLAWVNSVCILFLLIGLAGAKTSGISNVTPPPLEEIVPTIIEPIAPPTPATVQQPPPEQQNEQDKPDMPQVVAVTLNTPNINFSVPTIGNLMVPNGVATAPPAQPLKQVAPLRQVPITLDTTGTGGDRPDPPYPKMAKDLGQQGRVVLLITVDENGNIISIEVKGPATPMLDRSSEEFVKRHWIFPTGATNRVFEQPFNYVLRK